MSDSSNIEFCRDYLRNNNKKYEIYSFVSAFIILFSLAELISIIWIWDKLKNNTRRVIVYSIIAILKILMIICVSYFYNYTIVNYKMDSNVCYVNDVTLAIKEPNFFIWIINVTLTQNQSSNENYITTVTTNNNYPPDFETTFNYTIDCWYRWYSNEPSNISFSQSVYFEFSFAFLIFFSGTSSLNLILSIFYAVFRLRRSPLLIIKSEESETLL